MTSEQIRVTMHSEMLKFGHRPDPKEPTLGDQLHDKKLVDQAVNEHIGAIGYRLTYAQSRALFAIQTMLDRSDYLGNAKPVSATQSQRYHFYGNLPVLEVKTSDFLDAYGVKKTKTGRGREYSAQARRIALGALLDLSQDKRLFVYEKSVSKKSRSKVRVESIGPLLSVIKLNGGRRLRIVPNPILVDQIDSYFVLKPETLFGLVPDKDQAKVRFVEYLLYHANQHRRRHVGGKSPSWEIRIQSEGIAYALRLDQLLVGRKKKELRKRLNELYDFGVEIGYLDSFAVDQVGTKQRKMDVLKINRATFGYPVPKRAKPGTRKRNP
jgi:hypothetical protein